MKAIGYKIFRKFEDFAIMDMGDITMFVGGNNSGKSTTVKAIISFLTFLRNSRFYASGNSKQVLDNNFYFNENPYVHIGTFKRAKCNKNNSNDLSFEIRLENYLFSVFLNGEGCDENTTFAKIQRIILKDLSSNFIFDINYGKDEIIMTFNQNTEFFENNPQYIADIQKLNERKSITDKEKRIHRRYEQDFFDKYPVVDETFEYKAKITDVFNRRRMIGGPLISGILYNASYYFSDEEKLDTVQNNSFSKYDFLRTYMFRMSHILDNILWNQPLVEYIYAHAASQIVLYNSSDNNYLSKTIHEFADLRDGKDSLAFDFVRKWMRFFEIGNNFKLESIGGEAHTFDIIDFDNKKAPLADKGMGTIQLMILLLRIAIIINSRSRFNYRIPVTVIIEEPEQNLHPKKQSQLIEFFYQTFEEYKIKFIIETHSEYLIRRSQVMVAEKKYKSEEQLKTECPFKVYFYPENGLPYDMEYQINGRFTRDFESGFFDEASKYALQLSKIERGRK